MAVCAHCCVLLNYKPCEGKFLLKISVSTFDMYTALFIDKCSLYLEFVLPFTILMFRMRLISVTHYIDIVNE